MASKPYKIDKYGRKIIDLELKQKIIEMNESGLGMYRISRELGMAHSTVAGILKNKERLTEEFNKTKFKQIRESLITDMEKTLSAWIEEQARKYIILSPTAIMTKAQSLFDTLKKKAGPECDVEFCACSEWFSRFKMRFPIPNLNIYENLVDFDKELKESDEDSELDSDELENEIEELLEQERGDEEKKVKEDVPKKFTVEGLSKFFTKLNNLLKSAKYMDSNSERFTLIEQNAHSVFAEYKQIYDDLKKQNKQNISTGKKQILSEEESDRSSSESGENDMEMGVYDSDDNNI